MTSSRQGQKPDFQRITHLLIDSLATGVNMELALQVQAHQDKFAVALESALAAELRAVAQPC